jgi:hypothetical protein
MSSVYIQTWILQTLKNQFSWNMVSTTYYWISTSVVDLNFSILQRTNLSSTLRMTAEISLESLVPSVKLHGIIFWKAVILNTNTDVLQTSEVIKATAVLMLSEITKFQTHKRDRARSPLWSPQALTVGIYDSSGKYTAQKGQRFSSSCTEGRE